MVITKEITRLEKSSVRLSITVGKEDVRAEYEELLTTYSKSLQMPGFRKGKVPKDVLVRKVGDAIKGEVTGRLIEKSIKEVFEGESRENKPLPYSTPELQDEPELDIEKDLQFSIIYDVLPKVKVGKWEGLEVEVPDVSITEEDIAGELKEIRERNSIVLDKDDESPAALGDVVTVNYCELNGDSEEIAAGKVAAGKVTAGSEREDFAFTLGSGYNIYKFDDEIVGMKKGDQKVFTKTYPEDFQEEELAGKTKKIKINLTALKEKKLPELDDDLAQDVDEKFKTLDDLKNSIRERLTQDLETRLRGLKINHILEKVMEDSPVEIPESMLRAELDARWRRLARRFETDSNGLYDALGNSSEYAKSIINSWTPDAQRALHSRLIVETLIEELKLEVSDEEIKKEIEKYTLESGEDIEIVSKYFEEEQSKEYMKEEITERKFFDLLLEKNTIKAGQKESYSNLAGNTGDS